MVTRVSASPYNTSFYEVDGMPVGEFVALMLEQNGFHFGKVEYHLNESRGPLSTEIRRCYFIQVVAEYLRSDLSSLFDHHFPSLCSIIERRICEPALQSHAYEHVANLAFSIGMFTIVREIAGRIKVEKIQRELLDQVESIEAEQTRRFFELVEAVAWMAKCNGSPIGGVRNTLAHIAKFRQAGITGELFRLRYFEIATQKDSLKNVARLAKSIIDTDLKKDGEHRRQKYWENWEKLHSGRFRLSHIASLKRAWQKGDLYAKLKQLFQEVVLPDTLAEDMGVIKRIGEDWQTKEKEVIGILNALEESCKKPRENGSQINSMILLLKERAPDPVMYNALAHHAVPIVRYLHSHVGPYKELLEGINCIKNTLRQQFLTLEKAAIQDKKDTKQ